MVVDIILEMLVILSVKFLKMLFQVILHGILGYLFILKKFFFERRFHRHPLMSVFMAYNIAYVL